MSRAKPELRVEWRKRDENGHRDPALYYMGPKQTGGLLADAFEGVLLHGDKALVKELEERGYDITTLRFSVRKKATVLP